jgi:hypothetical protein
VPAVTAGRCIVICSLVCGRIFDPGGGWVSGA